MAPARRRRKKPGSPGYAGYEYQVSVTVWVALDLMLAKEVTEEVAIEPRSDEDLEAAARDPATALLGLEARGEQLNLVLQAKTRSGAPWSAPAFADVLLGKDANHDGGGRKRSRPLEMLEADPKCHYVFVTNEASVEPLRPHGGEHLFDFPEVDELPPHVRRRYDATARASLAPRIVLLSGVTEEVLSSRISGLLEQHGHVPKPKHDACMRDLRDEVRRRIKGEKGGRWTRPELLAILIHNGGSIAPTRDMDHYVRPSSYDKIKERLDNAHAVVIAGPAGTGKTLTADILEVELRRGNPPFDVVGEESGPGHVRHHLTRSDPILFHLRDPWGGNRLTPGADRWSGELPKLLESAGPGRKFLVTSRSDVLLSAGHDLIKYLQPFIVPIEIEDYGPVRLGEVYNRIAGDLAGHAASLGHLYRDRALEELTRPYEVKRFLVALSREDADKPRKVQEIIADSQIDAISRVIADQIAPLELDGVQSAAFIWAILSARGAVSRDVFAKLARRLRSAEPSLRPDVEGLIDFLVAGQNIRRDGLALSFYHPRVEDGLRLAFMRRGAEAEFLLSRMVDVLVSWDAPGADWGTETGLGILRSVARLEKLQLDLAPATRARLDQFLENAALAAGKRFDFERALRDLTRFGSIDHLPSQLARVLIEGGPKGEEPVFRDRWRAPEIDAREKAMLRADSRTKALIARFIPEVLPFSHRDYDSEVVALLGELAPDIQPAYWDALDTIAGPGGPHENIDVIVEGALSSEIPDYDRAIERFARSEAQADEWITGFSEDVYKAEEHVVDADVADHDIDEPGEQYFNARQGMKHVVRLRRKRDGVAWIASHPHAQLLVYALSDLIGSSRQRVALDELRLLLEVADDWTRDHAWWAVQQHWDARLSPYLMAELARTDMEYAGLRQRLLEIAAANKADDDFVGQLTATAAIVPAERRLELIRDLVATSLDDDPKGDDGIAIRRKRAKDLVATYPASERELACALVDVLTDQDISTVASSLTVEARTQAEALLLTASTDVAGPLAFLAAGAGLDIREAATRLLATSDAEDGLIAVQALLIANRGDLRESLDAALTHKRYRVRRKALRELVPDARETDRKRLALLAQDQSADMRLAFAELMQEHLWPESIDALVVLLGDTRNFASHLSPGASWSKFSVARAAANALGAYETLPAHAIDALIRAVEMPSADPFVACASLSALARHDDERVLAKLLAALQSPGLDGAPSHHPRAQAAAWAIFDRTVGGKLGSLGSVVTRMAEQDPPAIAGPLLVAAGILGGSERKALLERLCGLCSEEREAVVRVAAIAADKVEDMTLDGQEQVLLRLARGEELAALEANDRSLVEAWSKGLDLQSGFDRFVAWIARTVFTLPISGELDSIRTFDLPERISVMTMRSLSPYREEDEGPDDGT